MKASIIAFIICGILAFTACKSHMNTANGDSTGTGAAGARVPGKLSSDTTHHDTVKNSLETGIDSLKKKPETKLGPGY